MLIHFYYVTSNNRIALANFTTSLIRKVAVFWEAAKFMMVDKIFPQL